MLDSSSQMAHTTNHRTSDLRGFPTLIPVFLATIRSVVGGLTLFLSLLIFLIREVHVQ